VPQPRRPHTFVLPPLRLGWRARVAVLAGSLLSLYLLGFALYIVLLPAPFTTLPSGLQGLATFTGGSGRVEAALKQAQKGFPGPILISGSHGTTTLPDMLALTATPLTETQQQFIVYDTAATTRENILSLKAWAGYYQLEYVGIITSTYHVPRVGLLARLHAPHLRLTYLAVQPADPGLRPLFREYNKLLATPLLN